MSCIVTKRNHNLVDIMHKPSRAAPDADQVVRWCTDCGSIVVDIDADERTIRPGGITAMQFPLLAKKEAARADNNAILAVQGRV